MSIRILQRLYGPLFFLAVVGAFLVLWMPALSVSSQAGGFSNRAGGVEEQIEVVLHADNAPAPGGVASFTFTIRPLRQAPDLTVTWQLPDGGELMGGPDVESLGAVAAGATVTQTRQVRFATPGIYTVWAQTSYQPDSATTLGAVGVLFFTIDSTGSTASDGDPRIKPYQPPPYKPTIDKSGNVVAAGTWVPHVPQGCFHVFGFLSREERQATPGDPPHYIDLQGSAAPVHHVEVELREEDTFSDDSYGTNSTDANGRFDFAFCDDDGFLNDELELYYRVCAIVGDLSKVENDRIAYVSPVKTGALYCFDSDVIDSEGGDVDFDIQIWKAESTEAAIFNILDSAYWAWRFWHNHLGQGSRRVDPPASFRWERGAKVFHSSYNRDYFMITLADANSNPDEWDDSVIIQQWANFANHLVSCDALAGEGFSVTDLQYRKGQRAWADGFATYYQSAVRTIVPSTTTANFFIDVPSRSVDLEVVTEASAESEAGVAALLWDFFDSAEDGDDTVNHGHARIQRAFTDAAFRDHWQCNLQRFLRVWRYLDFPTDAATASTVVQNTNITTFLYGAVSAATMPPLSLANIQALNAVVPHDYRWWDQVTMVVDNSASMAQPPGTPKIEAAKSLIRQQVNDLTRNPRGTRFDIYTFDAASTANSPLLEGRFFAKQINPVLDGLQAYGADLGCPVLGLDALTRATQNKYDGQAWLYTDGDALLSTSVDYVQQQLNQRLIRGSVVLLGGCGSLPTVQSEVTGTEKNYLGLAADGSQPGGVVPYLLTAIGTGGQFLYVAPEQLANAVDILLAQSKHTAGAGRWSDYVSQRQTYRWDRLTSWEYNWVTPASFRGQAIDTTLDIGIPPVNVYGYTYDAVHVYGNGVIGMGQDPLPFVPDIAHYLDILDRDGMTWYYQSADKPGWRQSVFADDTGEWVVISTMGLSGSGQERAYQALFNKNTGEIRYQYQAVPSDDAANAEISIWEFDLNTGGDEVVVSAGNVNAALSGTGYKFTPAPPQPTKSYVVSVDAAMSGIGFLLTGYSGTFAPLVVTDPDGNEISCDDTEDVLCLNVGLVQYVQVDVNGRNGNWNALVSAGSSGQGTFSFSAMGASEISATALGKRTLSLSEQNFQLDLGQQADGNKLTGWLQTATGAPFGSAFSFYDDGEHDDGLAGDGLFGSEGYTPPGQGVAYLWMQGTIDGETIARSDPAPFNFQPIDVQPEPEYVQGTLGSTVVVGFSVTNQASIQHCYYWEVAVPPSLTVEGSSGSSFCLGAGETSHPFIILSHPIDDTPWGVAADINANFIEVEERRIVGSSSATVAFFRPWTTVEITNLWEGAYLRPNGTDTVTMTVSLLDDQGQVSGWSGSLDYTLDTTLGTVVAPTGYAVNGQMPIVFTSGDETGTALITFSLAEDSTTTLLIRDPVAAEIGLKATPTDLRGDKTTAALVATLHDGWGDPVVGQSVRLSVSDDDGREVNGSINGSSVFTATTNADGQVSATFTKGENVAFVATVRAEALVPDGTGFRVTHEASEILLFSGPPLDTDATAIFMPLIRGD